LADLERCPECGASWADGITCEESFHQMGIWEYEDPTVYPHTHHLMVLCYHLQHPSLYSPEGLDWGRRLLVDFLERGLSPQEVRRKYRLAVDSGNRSYKITGSADSHGAYRQPVTWEITAVDVTRRGAQSFVASVGEWARSVLESLRASGNLAASREVTKG
jgi:hypothetical protein